MQSRALYMHASNSAEETQLLNLVSGKVVDLNSSRVVNASVEFVGATGSCPTITKADGAYHIRLPRGTYSANI